jgi:hypothetical protein
MDMTPADAKMFPASARTPAELSNAPASALIQR